MRTVRCGIAISDRNCDKGCESEVVCIATVITIAISIAVAIAIAIAMMAAGRDESIRVAAVVAAPAVAASAAPATRMRPQHHWHVSPLLRSVIAIFAAHDYVHGDACVSVFCRWPPEAR